MGKMTNNKLNSTQKVLVKNVSLAQLVNANFSLNELSPGLKKSIIESLSDFGIKGIEEVDIDMQGNNFNTYNLPLLLEGANSQNQNQVVVFSADLSYDSALNGVFLKMKSVREIYDI